MGASAKSVLAILDVPTQSKTHQKCPYTMKCEKWDESASPSPAWTDVTSTDPPFNACTVAGGIFLEFASGDAGYDAMRPGPTVVKYRLNYESTYSKSTTAN